MINKMELIGILRLIIAVFCGLMIGYERKSQSKAAGVRTHCVVACASALMMIISKYAYFDMLNMSEYSDVLKLDPSRVASGVVSGIGFLGAGMIFIQHKTVTGLTTAAGIWGTAGVGMAIGAGLYLIGLASAGIIVLIQVLLHHFLLEKPETKVDESSSDDMTARIKELFDINPDKIEVLQNQNEENGKVYTIKLYEKE